MRYLSHLVPSRSVIERALMVAVIVVAGSGLSFATGTACDTMATIGDAITCVKDTINPNAVLVSVLTAFVPLLLVIWGLRGGFGLVSRIVKSMFSVITRRA